MGMINYETILSSYDDKLTLMQWLKKVEDALNNAAAVSFNVNKRGDATITFSVVFEDGSEIESNPLTLQQGESVQSAYIQNGHLHLVLTNGDDLDAGNMFNGNVSISGNLVVSGSVSTPAFTSTNDHIEAQKPIIELMEGYSASIPETENVEKTPLFVGVSRNGNKLTIAVSILIKFLEAQTSNLSLCFVNIPANIGNLIIPGSDSLVKSEVIYAFQNSTQGKYLVLDVAKYTNTRLAFIIAPNASKSEALNIGTTYCIRTELTILLGDSLL